VAVERSRWTDSRIDELAERVMRQDVLEVRFDALERAFVELRAEMREMRADVREMRAALQTEISELRTDLSGQVSALRGELYDTRRWLMTMWLTGLLALLAILVELSLRT